VGFYKKSFDAAKIKPDDIKSIADMKKLPFITRKDLRDNYPFGLFSVPMSSIVRLHASSGTSGRSAVFGYTKRDIETWSDLMARCLVAAGITKNDIIHNAFGYGLFTGGLGLHYGAEKIGASVIPMSGGNAKRQIMILQDFGPTVICCTPSYALHLAEEGKALGVDVKSLQLRVGIFGAEPWNSATRDEIEKVFGITALDLFGLSEVIGPGMAMECLEGRNGMHVFEDHFIVETINPKTGEVLPEGEEGELVFTTLTKEAGPLIRYRTGDISRLITEPCRCGRSHVKMERVLKRSDDMLIIRGVNIFPSQIEAILVDIEGLQPNYQIIVDKVGALDSLDLQVEVNEKIFSDSGGVKELQKMEKRIIKDMTDYLGITARVKLVEPNTLKSGAKIIDKRRY
jgi:phenylacetate-CoA ligase